MWMHAKRKLKSQFGISWELSPTHINEFMWRSSFGFWYCCYWISPLLATVSITPLSSKSRNHNLMSLLQLCNRSPHLFPQGLTVLYLVVAHKKSFLSSLVCLNFPFLVHSSLFILLTHLLISPLIRLHSLLHSTRNWRLNSLRYSIPIPLLRHHASAIITDCNHSPSLSPWLDLAGFWPGTKRNEKFGYCGLDLVYRWWISWSPWRGFCWCWEVFGDLYYITLFYTPPTMLLTLLLNMTSRSILKTLKSK